MARHGTTHAYAQGCRCGLCRDAKANAQVRHRKPAAPVDELALTGGAWTPVDGIMRWVRGGTVRDDDPRHGVNRGYIAGCREQCCREAHAEYRRHLRTRRYLNRGPVTVDGIGTRRRIQALMALGYSTRTLDAHMGQCPSYTYRLLADDGPIFLGTVRKVAAMYEALSMRIPTGRMVGRNKRQASEKGYAPPLAWTDIDDPTEHPRDWHYTAASRAEQFAELYDRGDGLADMCRSLHLSEKSLEKWCQRNDRAGDFTTLRNRDRGYVGQRNQYSEEAS